MKIQWKTCFKIGLSIFLLYLCIHYLEGMQQFFVKALGAASPLIIGCAIAYIVNLIMSGYEKHFFPATKKKFVIKLRRPLCMLLAFLTVIAIFVIVVSLVIPEFISCVQLIIDQLPNAIKKGVGLLEKIGVVPEQIIDQLSSFDWQAKIGEILEMASTYFGNVMNVVVTVVTAVFTGIVGAITSLFFAIYILLTKEKLTKQIDRLTKSYVKSSVYNKTKYFLGVLDECFHKYIVGQSTEAVILGVLCTIGMLVLRLPYATMIGALIALTALIPVIGAFIGAAVGAFMIAMVSPLQALIFIAFIVVLQQIEGNLIYSKVVGSSLGLPGIWVLAAVTVGGTTLGILGFLLGVPFVAAIYKILRADVLSREKTRQVETEELKEENAHIDDEPVKTEN